jgi:hypothetical protein
MRVGRQWQDSCSNLSVGSADQRGFAQTVGRSMTIILLILSATYWALIDMLLWPIGHRPTARSSELRKKSVDIFGSFAWIGGSRASGAACCLLFSGLSAPSRVTQIHEVLGVEPARIAFSGLQTMHRFLLPDTTPGAVQQGIAAIPAKDRRLVVGEYVKHLV